MRRILSFLVLIPLVLSCESGAGRLSRSEKRLICSSDSIMRVLTICDRSDSLLLRSESRDLSFRDIGSEEFAELSRRLVVTVQDTLNPGVGIAGPQVGLLRRVVAVCRFDKAGEPFEVYPNVRIIERKGELYLGPEGCLSVPDRRGQVPRYHNITISYVDPKTLETTTESVEGYTAVIFQHEVDHLEGVLYTDYLEGEE